VTLDAKFVKEYRHPEDKPDETRAYFERLPVDDAAGLGVEIVGIGKLASQMRPRTQMGRARCQLPDAARLRRPSR
jgi:hypothetical protein